jgi:hypothetical protein
MLDAQTVLHYMGDSGDERRATSPTSGDVVAFLAGPSLPWRVRQLGACHGHGRNSCSMRAGSPRVSRRDVLLAVAAGLAFGIPASARAVDLYEVHKPRYIPQGRPLPVEPAPVFDASAAFPIGEADGTSLQAMDVAKGDGELIERGTLVVASWKISLKDGTVIEETPAPSIFRAGTGQVYPGIDAAIIGMKTTGSERNIRGSATSFFSDITNGERSLVPSDATIFAKVSVIRSNPYGPR